MSGVPATMEAGIIRAIIRMDGEMGNASIPPGKSGISGDTADAVLERLAASDPSGVYVFAFDRNGTVLAAAPRQVRTPAGEHIGTRFVVQDLFGEQHPLLSGLSVVSPGRYGALIEYPCVSTGRVSPEQASHFILTR